MARPVGLGLSVLLAVYLSLLPLLVAGGGIAVAGGPEGGGQVTMEWLGWSHFRFTSPGGKVILINPFLNNPDSPVKLADIEKADLILAADGHGDEVGSTVEIALKTGARTVTAFELGTWLVEQGVPAAQVFRSNPGGRFRMDGITVRVVHSEHGSGLPAPTATTPYGGPAVGFFVTFENGWTVYFAGSTGMTRDQGLWAQMYQPDLVILPMDGNREPLDFAMMVKLLQTDNPRLSMVFPHHHRVTPAAGQTTVEEVQAALDQIGVGMQVTAPVLGQVYMFP